MANGVRTMTFSEREDIRENSFSHIWTEELDHVFADVAAYYDKANSVASLGLWGTFRESFLSMIELRSGQKALDVCAGTNAIGMSGADANAIIAHKRPVTKVDFGFVGDVDKVNAYGIFKMLQAGFTPIFCALTHNGKGQLFNTNADTIAAEVAIAMSDQFDTTLYYCFEKKGVLENVEDDDSIITHINSKTYEELLAYGIISDGMLPKMHN